MPAKWAALDGLRGGTTAMRLHLSLPAIEIAKLRKHSAAGAQQAFGAMLMIAIMAALTD